MTTRTAFFSRHQPGGYFSIEDMSLGTGSRFFVSSVTGTDGAGYGRNPDAPVATLDYAVGLCTASKGDKIYLMPGHAETKTTTGDIATVDIAGVEVIGLGNGPLRPTFTFGHAGTTLTVSAANCLIRNIKIISDVADCAVGITASATADGLTVENCDFYDGALTKELVIGISIAAACHEVTVRNNRFIVNDGDTGGCEAAIKLAGASNHTRIEGNFIQGNFTGYPIDLTTAASVGVIVSENSVFNTDTANGYGVAAHASTTGHVVRNLITNAKDTVAPVTAAACHVGQNYGSNAAGASGIIKPAVDS
jgi:nitrous oxidase accessory protein NosD